MSASMNMFLSRFSRLSLNSMVHRHSFHTQNSPLLFKFSEPLCAEPLKKKRKSDPNETRRRSDKLRKRFDRELKRLEKKGNLLKPIDEFEEWRRLCHTQSVRKRPRKEPSQEELEERVVIMKTWCKFKSHQDGLDNRALHTLQLSQKKALEELRKESEELYQKAIEVDENLYGGLVLKGPYRTPQIPDYFAPDGEYVDISRTDFEKPWTDPTKQVIPKKK